MDFLNQETYITEPQGMRHQNYFQTLVSFSFGGFFSQFLSVLQAKTVKNGRFYVKSVVILRICFMHLFRMITFTLVE